MCARECSVRGGVCGAAPVVVVLFRRRHSSIVFIAFIAANVCVKMKKMHEAAAPQRVGAIACISVH